MILNFHGKSGSAGWYNDKILNLVRSVRSQVGQVGFFGVRPRYFLREIPAGADFVNVHFVSDGAVNNFVAGHNSNTVLTVEAPSAGDQRLVEMPQKLKNLT